MKNISLKDFVLAEVGSSLRDAAILGDIFHEKRNLNTNIYSHIKPNS